MNQDADVRHIRGFVAGTPAGLLDTQLATTRIFMMPHKFNASRRHKFEKKRQKV
ncbi:MAG: hypothetical protein ACI8Z1_002810, partial [Candidatus Azotimanducaceae bacterium]